MANILKYGWVTNSSWKNKSWGHIC